MNSVKINAVFLKRFLYKVKWWNLDLKKHEKKESIIYFADEAVTWCKILHKRKTGKVIRKVICCLIFNISFLFDQMETLVKNILLQTEGYGTKIVNLKKKNFPFFFHMQPYFVYN